MSTTFSSIPIIDFKCLQSSQTKQRALKQLEDALFRVGFLYLINTGLEASTDGKNENVALTHESQW